MSVGPFIFEVWWFDGNIKTWLSSRLGIQYDQRNAFGRRHRDGICHRAGDLQHRRRGPLNVPKSQIAGSLALGATRWQTVLHLVLLSASPGIFPA